jgi:hypothetical protein
MQTFIFSRPMVQITGSHARPAGSPLMLGPTLFYDSCGARAWSGEHRPGKLQPRHRERHEHQPSRYQGLVLGSSAVGTV